MLLHKFAAIAAVSFAAAAFASPVFAAKPQIQTDLLSSLAVDGYDAVAYFEDGKPVQGAAQYSYEFKGATWRFASADHLASFRGDPTAYAPQYGGYCAWAVAQGYTAPGNPHNWRIVGGKLYLNYDDKVQRDWEQDVPGFIAKADANWPGVLD